MRLYYDIEANGFLDTVSKVWCICAIDLDNLQEYSFGPEELQEGLNLLARADQLVGHNGIRYDMPVLRKIYPKAWFVADDLSPAARMGHLDTLVLARLKFPNIKKTDSDLVLKKKLDNKLHGKDSLKAWGQRIGIHKTEYDGGFDAWSQEMQDYCLQDCRTGVALFRFLKVEEMDERAVWLEHRVVEITHLMELHGWPFDEKKAQALYTRLMIRKEELETTLVAKFGTWEAVDRVFTPKRDNKRLGYTAGVEVTKMKTVTFNPGSRQHIVKKLLEAGWKPEEFTDGGQPKLDEEQLAKTNLPEAQELIEYLLIDKRLGQLGDGDKGWLRLVKNGRIHPGYNPMGTVTSRAVHIRPNVSQTPSVDAPYGPECRECWTVLDGYKLLGADKEGLELRCLASYMARFDKGDYGSVLVNGDVHWRHTEAMGLNLGQPRDEHSRFQTAVRKGSKTFTYAYLYGAGDKKCGRIIFDLIQLLKSSGFTEDSDKLFAMFFAAAQGKSVKDSHLTAAGGKLKRQFLTGLPALARLKKFVSQAATRGFIKGLDGRHVPVRSSHAALNSLLQSAGAILCKTWLVDAYDNLLAQGFRWGKDFVFLGWIHDEIQTMVRDGLEEDVGKIIVDAARNSASRYKFKCRLDSKFIVGTSWKDTH